MKKTIHIHRAVTLLELVVSMSIASLVLTGIGSSMVLASRALPGSKNHLSQSIACHQILEKMSSEISVAQTIPIASLNAVEFTVPDRDANGAVETLRYEWSGVVGDPLYQKHNLFLPVMLFDHVEKFELYYDLDTSNGNNNPSTTDQPFTQFVSVNIDAGTAELSYDITDTTWLSQFIVPDLALLPANTVQWKLDQVAFSGKINGAPTGVTNVEIRNDRSNGEPAEVAIEGYLLQENTLSSTNWTTSTIDFTSAPWLNPTQGIYLTFSPQVGSTTITSTILYQQPTVTPANMKLFMSSDAGVTWVQAVSQSLTGFYVYGTARINNSVGQPASTNKLNTVTFELQVETGATYMYTTTANILNHPDVTVQ